MKTLLYDAFEAEELTQRELRLSSEEADYLAAIGATVQPLDSSPNPDGKSWYLVTLNR